MTQQQDIWDADTARSYDTPGQGMFSAEVLDPTVERLAELARGGGVLEFAIGTGRVAGFELEYRWADWKGAEFTAESRSHVSVYRLAQE